MAGPGPDAVVYLHGVGLDPRLFAAVMERTPHPSVAPLRSPYRDGAPIDDVASVEDQAVALLAELAELVDRAGAAGDGSVDVVGVSGGATIVVAAAIALGRGATPSRPVGRLVAHEPLIGPLAPDLHAGVAGRAARLAGTPGDAGVDEFLSGLVGDETWLRLPDEARRFALDHGAVVRAEVERFVAFAPTRDDLATVSGPLTITTGADSSPARHRASAVLAELSGAAAVVVDGARHLAHCEAPDAFVAAIEGSPR